MCDIHVIYFLQKPEKKVICLPECKSTRSNTDKNTFNMFKQNIKYRNMLNKSNDHSTVK